ncbi:MAG: hypothetical protein FJZ01_08585 [Candidatus Sericytochromatia bacterium]|nr:hypothetical protein [Candidatus Tanganyikabacteria bacterium]
MRNPDSYPASTIDAKLDVIMRMIDGLAAVMNAKFEAVDRRFEAVDRRFESIDRRFDSLEATFSAKLEGEVRRLDTRIDGLRNEIRIWVLIAAVVISPLITTLMTRAVATAWPQPGAPAATIR